jgi:hypothetical protein
VGWLGFALKKQSKMGNQCMEPGADLNLKQAWLGHLLLIETVLIGLCRDREKKLTGFWGPSASHYINGWGLCW